MEFLPESGALSPDVSCENCTTQNPGNRKFCSQCSFPIGGTDDEQRSFRLLVSSRKRLLGDANDKIKGAKTAIYILAGIFFVFGGIAGLVNDDVPTLVVNLCLCILFLIFAAWSTKNPFGAILTAFMVYLTVQVVNAFVDPVSIFSGLIIKIFVIAAFIKGIRSAQEGQGYLKELEKLKAVPVDNG
ncbi:MAG TPA: hypothetical protein VFT15_16255 [Chitinophagaceae bacterium]|nr:hypothetical protein [Chitinophagaceae bacterium]